MSTETLISNIANESHRGEAAPFAAEQSLSHLAEGRIAAARASFVTRRVNLGDAATLLTQARPRAGDVVLARVKRLRHHARLQCASGRRVQLFHGDEIVVCYGDRYAPQQFEAYVPETIGPCHLVASGGVAAQAINWHQRIHRGPTEIEVLGILGDQNGRALNLRHYALPSGSNEAPRSRPRLVVLAGTSMDSGKTTSGAHLVRGLSRAGLRVGAAKVTGTGACNDFFLMQDAGASVVLDFTDAGHVSTYRVGEPAIRRIVETLSAELSRHELDVAVLEVADGLVQAETAALLSAAWFRHAIDGVIFCAQDAMGAKAGVEWLEQRGHDVLAVSGVLTAAPLAMREAGDLLQQPVIGLDGLSDRYVSRSLVARDARGTELRNACTG